MKLEKFLLTLATTAFVASGVFVMSVSIVSADEHDGNVEQENKNTGPHSKNKNVLKVRDRSEHIKKNLAKVKNKVHQHLNTGGVKQKHNNKGGKVKTGDITTFVDLKNKINQGDDCGCPDEHDGDHDVSVHQSNKNTGPKSKNKNVVKVSSSSSHKVINKAKVNNHVGLNANTGGVKQTGNNKAGKVKTGDISVGVSIKNNVN